MTGASVSNDLIALSRIHANTQLLRTYSMSQYIVFLLFALSVQPSQIPIFVLARKFDYNNAKAAILLVSLCKKNKTKKVTRQKKLPKCRCEDRQQTESMTVEGNIGRTFMKFV